MRFFETDEQVWLHCECSSTLIAFFDLRTQKRKMRLWQVACTRCSSGTLSATAQSAIEIAEQFADGQKTAEDLEKAELIARTAYDESARRVRELDGQLYLASAGVELGWHGEGTVAEVRLRLEETYRQRDADRRAHAATLTDPGSDEIYEDVPRVTNAPVRIHLLRDIFGNPFRPIPFDLSWQTSTVLALAKQMYESRDFSAMPILADALQDAGCDNDEVLAHCRGPGPHVKGCWVVDRLLGFS